MISSWSTSPKPAAGSTHCTCWPLRCSTGRRSTRVWPTAPCWATTARRCRSRRTTTPTYMKCSTHTAPTPCAGSCCHPRCCAVATWWSPIRASETVCAKWYCRCGTPGTSSRCTPTRPATKRRFAMIKWGSWTGTSLPSCTIWWSMPPIKWTPTTSSGRADPCAAFWRYSPTGTSAVRGIDSGTAPRHLLTTPSTRCTQRYMCCVA